MPEGAPIRTELPTPGPGPGPGPGVKARAGDFVHARRAFRSLERAHGFEPLELDGELPSGLAGTLYRNGPGAYESFGERYGHWFDGDGAISAVRIADGQARGAAVFVETEDRAAEHAAGRRLFPNFGTRPPDLRSRLRAIAQGRVKLAANTNVLPWRDQLLALHEGSPPIALDPDTLESRGATDLGVLVGCMSAHPHRVAAHRCTYNFGVGMQRGRPSFDLYAFPDAGAPRRLGRIGLRRPMMIHDFIATERHLVFLLGPVTMRLLPMVLRGHSYVESLRWRPELGTEVVVVPIAEPDRIRRFAVEPMFVFHFANAFESGEDELTLDFVHYPDFPTINRWLCELIEPGPVRTAIDGTLVRGRLRPKAESLELEQLLESCEFPRVAPAVEGRRHRAIYLAGHAQQTGVRPGAQDHLIKIDLDDGARAIWEFGPETYPSEPVFAPDPARADREDGGWLLSIVYDGLRDRSYLAVVDAQQPDRGVLARAWFDHHVPPTFHGNWLQASRSRAQP